jgi:hypothetical protein
MENVEEKEKFNYRLLIGGTIILLVVIGAIYLLVSGSSTSKTTVNVGSDKSNNNCIGCNQENASSSTLSESQARMIAEETCIKGGESLDSGYYNGNSKTWWFDANLNSVNNKLCNPACVVSEETKNAEINYRCTGLK